MRVHISAVPTVSLLPLLFHYLLREEKEKKEKRLEIDLERQSFTS